ncbi:MAG: class I SAM-dependent methyltransferase [Alphaproteobacteria bacterium]
MNTLKEKIHNIIVENGPISIASFMEISLSDKKYGYYRKKMPLGSKGDFVTSPDISQIFGEIIGIWILDIWIKLKEPNNFQIVDLGGGRGTLLKDINRVLKNKIKNFIFIDINEELIKLQNEALNGATHFEKINDIPKKPTIFIGNEFLDTFPVHQFIKKNNYWKEVCVNSDNKELFFSYETTKLSKKLISSNFVNLKEDSIIEINFKVREIINNISNFIKKNSGAAIFFDYGYLDGHGDSFQGIKDNKPINPLSDPGFVDLTSHVNFKDIKLQAKKNNINFYGPNTQSLFLEEMGAIQRLRILERNAKDHQRKDLRIGLNRLMSDKEMGNLFKVIALSSKNFPSLEGFTCGTTTNKE